MRRQQIIETVECDQCGEETDEPSSWTVEIGKPGGGRPIRRAVDLCPAHVTTVAELYETLRRVGRPVVPGPTAAADGQCPVCDKRIAEQYLSAHLMRQHSASAPQPPQCPDCDDTHANNSSLISHRTKAHGYSHRAALLASLSPSPKRKASR